MNVKKVMVVGAGIMGSGIAQACVEHGISTILADVSKEYAISGKEKIEYFLQRKVEKGKIEKQKKEEALSLLSVANDFKDGADADLVIEAATENVEIKKNIFKTLDKICKQETILASNTSTISITLLAGETMRPKQVIGIHFFVPAPVMKLIEVTSGILTSSETEESAMKFSEIIGKVPVKAPDTSAFLVNRLLVPMWNEAMFLVQEGNAPKDIDTAMRLGGNLPMGPLELADFAGLDTVLAVMTQMHEDLGESKYRPCPLLKKMVNAKLLGRKTKKGFYEY